MKILLLFVLYYSLLVVNCSLSFGQWLWSRQGISGIKENTLAPSVATNGSGKVWETGYFNPYVIFSRDTLLSSSNSAFLVNYDKSGNLLWARQSTDSTDSESEGTSVAVDNAGNSYITGYFKGKAGFGNKWLSFKGNISSFLVKYDVNGNVLWAKQSTGTGNCYGESVASNGAGSEYVTGNFSGTVSFGAFTLVAPNIDEFLVKYDNNGNVIWAVQSTSNGPAYATSVAWSSAGDEYVTGYFQGTVNFGITVLNTTVQDIFLAKYDTNGNIIWALQSATPGNVNDIGYSVTCDKYDNAYLTGSFDFTLSFGNNSIAYNIYNNYNLFYAKFTPYGGSLWLKQPKPLDNDAWYGCSVSTDKQNHFYLSGETDNLSGYYSAKIAFDKDTLIAPTDYVENASVLIKFDSSGSVLCGSIIDDFYWNMSKNSEASDSSGLYVYLGGTFTWENIIVDDTLLSYTNGDQPFTARWTDCSEVNFSSKLTSLPTCKDYCTGSATAFSQGGSPPYTYKWSNGETTQTATGLCAGKYTVTVMDTSGVKVYQSITVTTIPYSLKITHSSDSICPGRNVNLNASGIKTYNWFPAVGLSCITCPDPVATPTTTTTYYVTGEDTNSNGCIDTSSIKILVSPIPNIKIVFSGACIYDEDKLTASGAISYKWSPADSLSCPTCAVTRASPAVTTTYTVIGSINGCLDSATITVKPFPKFDFTVTPPYDTICNGDTVRLTASGNKIVRYGFSPNTDLSCNTCSSAKAYPKTTITYTVIAYDSLNCDTMRYVTITVLSNIAKISVHPDTICSGDSTQLIAESGTQYLWSTGQTTDTIWVKPNTTKTYSLTAITKGCTATGTVTVTVFSSIPNLNIASSLACQFYGTRLTASGASGYSWSPASSLSCPTCAVTIATPTVTTTYTVIGNGHGCFIDTATITVIPFTHFDLKVTPASGTICKGDTLQFSATGNKITRFGFIPDSNLSCNTCSTTRAYPQKTTTYTVVAYDSAGCDTTIGVTITVLKEAENISVHPDTICPGDSTELIAAKATNYLWSTGQTSSAIWVKPAIATFYSLSAIINGCTATDSVTVHVINAQLTFSVSPSDTICPGDSTRLVVSGGSNYVWSNRETSSLFWVKPLTTTTYTVTGISNKCTASNMVTIHVTPPLQLTITPPSDTLCPGNSVGLTVTGAHTYNWLPAAGLSCTNCATPLATPAITTTYTVTGAKANGCNGSNTVTIHVIPLVASIAATEDTICNGGSTILTASGGATYLWSNSATTSSIKVSPVAKTTYTVTVSDGPCSKDTSITINLKNKLNVTINANTSICKGDSTTITATGGSTYIWSNNATTTSITVSPPSTTTFTVKISNGACYLDTDITIRVSNIIHVAINANSPICKGDTATITASGGSNYLWSNNETTSAIIVNPQTTTTYTVSISSGTCKKDTTIQIKVNPSPIPSISGLTPICQGDSTILTASGGTSYFWSNSLTSSSISVSPLLTTTYSVAVSNGICTKDTGIKITVSPLPSPSISGNNALCKGNSTTLIASGGTNYLWSNAATNSAIHVTPDSTTTYSVKVSIGTCSKDTSITVFIGTQLKVTINTNSPICKGDTATITASGGSNYIWSNNATTSSIIVSPQTTTTYTVSISNGICSKDTIIQVKVNPLPVPLLTGATTICAGDSTTLTASGGTNYIWSNSATTSSITISPINTATYSLNISNGLCNIDTGIVITVNPLPNPSVTGNKAICKGDSTMLSASGGINYIWSNAATNNAIYVSPDSTTTYSVTVSIGTCSMDTSITVKVNPQPSASISGNTPICNGDSTTLAASGGISYLWSNSATSSTIVVNPPVTTTYSVSIRNGSCTKDTGITIIVNSLPNVSISGNTQICAGGSAILNVSGGVRYLWSNSATTGTITVSPDSTATYLVKVSNLSCTIDTSVTVTVSNQLKVTIHANSPICKGETTTITAAGGLSYLWSNNATTSSIIVSPQATTTFTVSISNGICNKDTTYQIAVNPLPNPSISGTTPICLGESATITANGGTSYLWSNNSTTSSITVSPISTTTFTVSVSNGKCSKDTTFQVSVNPLPTPSINGLTPICQGNSTTLTAGGGTSYIWSNSATTSSITVTPLTTTTFTVSVSNGTCSKDTGMKIIVKPLPNPSITGTDSLCKGKSTTLIVSGGGSYSWSTAATTDTINVTPPSNTYYYVTVTLDSCSAKDSIEISVFLPPVPGISATQAVCPGQKVNITAKGGTAYLWSTGDTASTITVNPSANTVYTVSIFNVVCSVKDSSEVIVNPNPDVIVCCDSSIIYGQQVQLSATGNQEGYTYYWGPPAGLSCLNCPDPVATPGASVIYSLLVTSDSGCTETKYITIDVRCGDVYVPNVFAPNGNDFNNILYVRGTCINIMDFVVFDRWGNKVFESNSINFGWDGTDKGQPMNTATFAWYLKATLLDGTNIEKKGNVTLLR